jgi:phospho-N-acetylmuramoyl-pentapeptide-transferase
VLIEFLYRSTDIYLFYSRLFSTAMATICAFTMAMLLLPYYIRFLKALHFSSELNGDDGRHEPVMPAGILFFVTVCIVSLLTARINSFVLSAFGIYGFFSLIGMVDDVAKIINKRRLNKGRISVDEFKYKADGISAGLRLGLYVGIAFAVSCFAYKFIPNISGHITIPFLSIKKTFPYMPFWLFIPFMTLIIAVLANGVNFTDGIDTLATVPLITCYTFVGVVAYISANSVWSEYLLIPHIAGIEEILPITGAVIGVLLAFLWYNAPPSSIIMGDSGSIGLGGMMAIMFVFIKAEFYLPIVGIIFVLEFLSDIIQIGWFKATGTRVFRMAPLHHHFHLSMLNNPHFHNNHCLIKMKIAWRYHIVSAIALVLGLILFFKVR